VLSQEELLRLLDKAMSLKGGVIEITDLDEAVLQPQKFTRFVRQMQEDTVILPEARYITMDSQIVDIDRIAFLGRVLKSGDTGGGGEAQVHRNIEEKDFTKPAIATNKLTATEFQAIVSLRDKMLRRNIEKEGFENTLIDMLGEAVGRDSEELYILGDKLISYSDDDVLSKFDGWVRLAANFVYGGDKSDFDPTLSTFPENMFKAILDATPKQYLKNRAGFRFWVDYDTDDKYRDILKARNTPLGDSTQTGFADIAYKGIPVKRAPMIERSRAIGDKGGSGTICLFGYPNNLVWGVFAQIAIEREREAKLRRTDFVLSLEVACNYEDENAATVAYIEKENPIS